MKRKISGLTYPIQANGPVLIVKGLPPQDWYAAARNDEERKAAINAFILLVDHKMRQEGKMK